MKINLASVIVIYSLIMTELFFYTKYGFNVYLITKKHHGTQNTWYAAFNVY